MIGVHGTGLAAVIPCLVGILIVHVIRNSNFRIEQRVVAHIVQTFITKELQLIPQTISDRSFANFDGKGRSPIFAPKNTDDVHIIETIPVVVSLLVNCGVY